MSVFGSPTRRACNACPGVAFYYHKAHEITNSDKEPLIRALTGVGLLSEKSTVFSLAQRLKDRLKAYITARLGKYIGAVFPASLILSLQASIARVSNFNTFDAHFRVYTHAQGAPIEYIRCTENGASRTKATRVLVDTYDGTRWVENFSAPLVELDHDMNYIMLDESDKACMFYEKPGPELLAKITQHEAEAFMSKHGLRADMEAMRLDMHKDYGALMDGVTREAASLGLRL